MQKKKAITTLITAMLMLSFMAIQPAGALTVNPIGTVHVGDEVDITVIDTTPGGLVRLYWDTVKAWDGKAGLIAEAYAVGTTATMTIVIPEAVQGLHYVVAKDVESGTTAYAITTVDPKIELSPDKAIPEDTITVSGKGFAGGTSAIVLYDPVVPAGISGENIGTGDGETKTFSVLNKPIDAVTAVYLDGVPTVAYTVEDYVAGIITFDTAPGENVVITADYTYHDADPKVSTTTDSLGSFSVSLKVPDPGVDLPVTMTIGGLDGKANYVEALLEVVSSIIKLDPEKGYIDATVTVEGRGFTGGETVDIRWYMNGAYITVVDDFAIKTDGSFSTSFKVPLVPDPTAPGDDYDVKAVDSASPAKTADATFKVIAPAKITLSRKQGKVDATISVVGVWFTPNKKVTFRFNTKDLATIPSPAYADGFGSFSVSFKVPDVAVGTYTVKATDEEGVSATATFDVIVLVTLVETRAAKYLQGDTVSIRAESSEDIFDLILEITDPDATRFWRMEDVDIDVEVDGLFLPYAYVTVPLPSDALVGSWNFTAYDIDEAILNTNLFTVAERPTMATVVDAVDEVQDSLRTVIVALDDMEAAIEELEFPDVSELQEDLDTIIDALATLSDIETSLADIEGLAESAATAAADASGSAGDAKTAAQATEGAVSGISMAVYGALILSLVAALGSIFAVIILQRKVAS